MSNREQYIIIGATSVDSSSPEMLVPVSGAILTIEGMTSGNVLLEQYLSAGWTTIATYTADTVVKVGIAPGNLIRISWDTVVGTPSISVLPTSDNGFAEVATDISVIEADIDALTVVTYTAATCPAAASSSGVTIRLSDVGSSTNGSLWRSNGTYWLPAGGGSVTLARSSVALSDTTSGLNLAYAKVSIPTCIVTPNIHFRIYAAFSHSAGGTTKTLRAFLSSNNISIGSEVAVSASNVEMAGMTVQTTATSSAIQPVISCRNSVSSQNGFLMGWRSQSALSPSLSVSSAFNMSSATHYIYICALKANAGDTMTLEDYVIEVC